MSESMTRLERVEADVEKAQAALGMVGGVVHTAAKVQGAGRRGRKRLRTMSLVLVVGGVVACGVAVIVSRRRRARDTNEFEADIELEGATEVDIGGGGVVDAGSRSAGVSNE
jgi:hypothetical protein